jgi:DNA polymerase I-like protein with 3'-5' exonuclease and polymerase domains
MQEKNMLINGIHVFDWIKQQGILNYDMFVNHLKKVEDIFWNERFKVYNQWKDDIYQQYLKQGYIDTLTGFRLSGIMSQRDVTNYPIQGSSFHCELKTLIAANKYLKRNGMKTMLIGQIHDSILADIHEDELDDYVYFVNNYIQNDLTKEYPWLILPMMAETEISDLNGNWFEMEEYTHAT